MPCIDQEDDERRAAAGRRRPCLKCQTIFSSAWSGERICPRCKSSKSWQSGGLSRSFLLNP